MTSLGAVVRVISRGLCEGVAEASSFGTHENRLAEFAADTDVVALCCTQNTSTIGMVNREFLSHFRDGLLVINVARVRVNDTYFAIPHC